MIRDICGTDSGYRKHRRMGEEKCQPCKDAHNVVRRATYDPSKNAKYANKYKDKAVRPAVKARKQQRLDAKAQKRAEIEARKKDRKERGILYKAKREEARIAHLEKMAAIAKRREEERLAIDSRKKEQELKRQKREEAERLAKEAKERKVLIRRLLKAMKAYAKYQTQLSLANQHGTSIGDYIRCKKLNGTACESCRAFAAEYVRKYNQNNPEKSKAWSRLSNNRRYRRALDNGQEFYTSEDVLSRWGTNCHLCNTPIDFSAPSQCGEPGWQKGLHLDHVVPLSKGGSDTLDNVKPAHALCNISKGDLMLDNLSATA